MNVSEYDYSFPESAIAVRPPEERGSSKLFVVFSQTGEIVIDRYDNLNKYLTDKDVLVRNITKVFHARLFGVPVLHTGEKLETFLNNIHVTPQPVDRIPVPTQELFEGVFFEKGMIDASNTPIQILKRIPESTWRESSIFLKLRGKPLKIALLDLLQILPKPKHCRIDFRQCFCEHLPCTCSKAEKLVHTEQLYFLKNRWK